MKKKLFLILLVFALGACHGKEVKQPSPESRLSLETFAVIETIRDAFVKNEIEIIRTHSTADGYKDITANKKPSESVELTFTPRWVEIDGDQVTVNVTWKSKWRASGGVISDRGMAVFVLEGRPLKVAKILRANPFLFPEQK